MNEQNDQQLPPELRDLVDEYDRDQNAEVLADYEQLFAVLREMHQAYPSWRFGQMITNLAAWSGTTRPGEAYDVPDERLLRTALDHLAKRRAQLRAAPAKS